MRIPLSEETSFESAIAVVGMAGRFPGAASVAELWTNLCRGVESISRFTADDLRRSGIDPAVLDDPKYVPAGAVLEGSDRFDPALFQVTPRDAELLDPQHRIFLECAWEALEDAGVDPARFAGGVGVFGGTSLPSYYIHNLLPRATTESGGQQLVIANDKDFVTTRVSYKLDLRGPSFDVQTACSTSLVAIVLACQSLLNYQCELALAGGVSVREPQRSGYVFLDNGVLAKDGHCRPFDAQATGTVPGNGAAIVVLKRLSEAIADGDRVHAVVRGAALNNDGSAKVGFTAPSVQGQAEVIGMALAVAGVEPADISYVETHGTATPMGDPIEFAALDRVYNANGPLPRRTCALGSVKSNMGHLDAAAGVTGFIKAVLALENRQIPPTLHFETPNPEIDLDSGPFYVNNTLIPWETESLPRRAGVSSFGIGGTNAHLILEEAPPQANRAGADDRPREAPEPLESAELLILSARTESSLDRTTARLADQLTNRPDTRLADVAETLATGRRQLSVRRAVVVRGAADAAHTLSILDPERVM
ncbi:MAG TPA: polyketide synthase, partial [Thermoanaerobaculia bacterium]